MDSYKTLNFTTQSILYTMRHAEEIQKFIETATEGVDSIVLDGGLAPMFLILHCDTDSGEYTMTPFEIPPMLMDSDKGKDILVQVFLPTIKEILKENDQEIVCICFTSEIWRYAMKKDYVPESNVNYREEHEEKKEACFWAFYLKDKTIHAFREMLRDGEKLVGLGELEVMNIKNEDNAGRFSNLF